MLVGSPMPVIAEPNLLRVLTWTGGRINQALGAVLKQEDLDDAVVPLQLPLVDGYPGVPARTLAGHTPNP